MCVVAGAVVVVVGWPVVEVDDRGTVDVVVVVVAGRTVDVVGGTVVDVVELVELVGALVVGGTVVVVVWAQAAEAVAAHPAPATSSTTVHLRREVMVTSCPLARPGARFSSHPPGSMASMGRSAAASTTTRAAGASRGPVLAPDPAPDLAPDLASAVEVVASFVETFEPGAYGAADAEALVTLFTRIERLGGAGKLLVATRAAEARCHEQGGHRSAAHWLAEVTGDSVGGAAGVLELGEAISSQPEVEDGLRRAKFSPARAKAVSDAANVNPASAEELVRSAESDTFTQLKERCGRAKAEGRSAADEAARSERLRRRRSCRTWTDDNDGAFCLFARHTPDDGARVKAALVAEADRVFDRARRAGRKDTPENYAADALVALVAGGGGRAGGTGGTGGTGGAGGTGTGAGGTGSTDTGAPGGRRRRDPKAVVHLRVDLEALRNGRVGAGQLCEIPGVGPIPVERARELMGDALVKVVITDGVDVATVCNLGRSIPAAVLTALIERDPTCVVPGCDAAGHLEVDHWQKDFARGGQTRWANLARLCGWHHSLKTHQGFTLAGGPGKWEWLAPPTRDRGRDRAAAGGRAGPTGTARAGPDPPPPPPLC